MFERCPVPPEAAPEGSDAWTALWMRMPDPVALELSHAALAYLSDDVPTDAVLPQHPEALPAGQNHGRFMVASLDHAVWFHRPFDPAQWHLFDATSQGFGNGRGLTVGHVFSTDGTHVATVTQEVLIRRARSSA
jgi:acyl-CoA thioesterase-2